MGLKKYEIMSKETRIIEAIILAGGLGTRLRSAVPDLPKCMAPVNGKPFITYVIDGLKAQGIEKFILALGYKSKAIVDFITDAYPHLPVQYSLEEEPLGTGGAIYQACSMASTETVIATNGDTLFHIDIAGLAKSHLDKQAECTLSLKPMQQFSRYGVVDLNAEKAVISFKEKQFYETGLINGGVYAINIPAFLEKKFADKFSFEKEYLETYYTEGRMYGFIQEGYFIDIGRPEDYNRAQTELKL